MPIRLPWRAPAAAAETPTETKTAAPLAAVFSSRGTGWTNRSYPALARDGYLRNPVGHRCVRLVAEAAASVPLLLYGEEGELSDHPALALVRRPNGRTAGADFFEALYSHLAIAGNAYLEPVTIAGALREIYLLRPERMRVLEGSDGWPSAYEYRAGNTVRRFPVEGEGPRLLHLKTFHPLDDHLGYAPLSAAMAALDLHNAASVWNKALLDNSARPSGALVYQPKEGGNLSPAQYDRLKQELEEGYSGAVRAGRPLLLEGGLDWKAMALSPRDMDFIEAKNGAARDIALALGVPPMLIGVPGDNTYANYQEANRAFWRLTVLPTVGRVTAALSPWLSDAFGERLRLEADLDQVSGLSAERGELWQRLSAAGFLTDAEKREAVGYAPEK
ncbi:phage portal protein [Ectorhizobium quercum]|uniref:phage portal protein n=1 Tax=Ectorhizobium quercum TaxID=2965071 RepID=UPI003F975466